MKDLLALDHRGCRRSKLGNALLRLLSEDSHGEKEDSNISAYASQPWQWQWPQAADFWMQPMWQWQVHQTQSPLEPATARSAAHGTNAAEAEASAARRSPDAVSQDPRLRAGSFQASLVQQDDGPQPRLASLVLERSPDARSDSSYSSTTFVPDGRFGRSDSLHSQALNTEEAGEVNADPARSSGQANLSDDAKAKVLPQPAQQPLASSPGEAGESSQVQVQEAPLQHLL